MGPIWTRQGAGIGSPDRAILSRSAGHIGVPGEVLIGDRGRFRALSRDLGSHIRLLALAPLAADQRWDVVAKGRSVDQWSEWD